MIKNNDKIIKDITDLTAALSGISSEDLNSNSRAREFLVSRMVAGNFLMRDLGYSYSELAKHIKRDRTSFYYYESQHKDNYKYWDDYRELYDNLKSAYLGIDNLGMTEEKMQHVFDEAGILSEPDSPFMISFKIGNTEQSIFTKKLEATIKLLKEAFNGFNCSFSVEHINSWSYEG